MRSLIRVHRGAIPKPLRLALMAFALLVLATVQTVQADGFIIPEPPPHVVKPVPGLAVKYHRVQVTIEDQVARTHIDQIFVNDSDYELEGTYIFPLPEDAAISDFAMFVDGERLSGKVLDKHEARRIYEDIVRRDRDPALLEYVGRDAFQARIYPIPAYGEKRVQLTYSQVLLAEQGLVHYVYPLSTEQFSSRLLEEVVITIDLQSSVPIKAIYSPSHTIAVERSGETSVWISFEANDVRPDTDFELYYTIADDDVGINLLSYRGSGEDGFFLLLVAPKMEADDQAVIAKDVIFVLDTSGSMEGKKLQQAKDGLEFVLERLNEDDRFNVIAFDTSVKAYARSLRPASEVREARRFVRGLSAGGGTNIHRALMQALDMTSDERPQFIIFLTDGLPTAGVTDVVDIIAEVDRATPAGVRLFTFGVGYDVNTVLLDTISQEHRGASAYVEPDENLEVEVSTFYAKISTPLLSNLELQWKGVMVDDLYPYPLPDLFAGTQLLVAGRYRGGGAPQVTLQGTVNGRLRTFSYPAIRLPSQGGHEFIPRLWATRKIGHLIKEIRLHGENRELLDEIISLSVRYGIMTPYTSFLVDERQDILTDYGRETLAAGSRLAAPMGMPVTGAEAVADSQVQSSLSQSERGGGSQVAEIKVVANKTFVLRDGIWTDTTYDPQEMRVTPVRFGSETYFALLANQAEWGKYLAVGDRTIVVLDGIAYEIDPSALESNSAPVPRKIENRWEWFWNWLRSLPR